MSGDFNKLVYNANSLGMRITSILSRIQKSIQELEQFKADGSITTKSLETLKMLKKQEGVLIKLHVLNNYIIRNFNRMQDFLKNTRRTFIINGLIIAVLLCGFFILPSKSESSAIYWLLIVFGFTFTALSLFLILQYILTSLEVGLKGRKIEEHLLPESSKE